MSENKSESTETLHTRILHLGILFNIFLPLVMFFISINLRDRLLNIQSFEAIDFLFYILILVSLFEILAIFLLRKKLLMNLTAKKIQNDSKIIAGQNIVNFGMIIYALSLAPTIYGLVYYLLGGIWERFALFVAITFLSFQLFKPREGDIDKLRNYMETV